MKVLKAESFQAYKDLIKFVEKYSIPREDIFSITANAFGYTFFFYV